MRALRAYLCIAGAPQGESAVKNADLAVAARSAEAMLHEISASTAVAEKEKSKVAVIVSDVSNTAAARPPRPPPARARRARGAVPIQRLDWSLALAARPAPLTNATSRGYRVTAPKARRRSRRSRTTRSATWRARSRR